MLGNVCVRKNVLGNMAFGFIARMVPAYPLRWLEFPPDQIKYAYGEGLYDPKHPHAKNCGPFAGARRCDNLVAFALGYYFGAPPGITPPIFKETPEEFAAHLALLLSDPAIVSLYATLCGKVGKHISGDTLTFIPEYGGFNTQSCKRCMNSDGSPAIYRKKTSSIAEFEAIEKLYNKSRTKLSLDDWLRGQLEDYVKDYPVFE